jgi:hypothetical protein
MPKISRVFQPDLDFTHREMSLKGIMKETLFDGGFVMKGTTQSEEVSLTTVLKWQLNQSTKKKKSKTKILS